MREQWDRFWFQPIEPLALIVTRSVLCLNALWLLLSKPDLPEVLRWPDVLWAGVRPMTRVRYLMFDVPFIIEQILWIALFVCLAAALFGIRVRLTCALAAVLLYHFAPLESVLYMRLGPYFNGLTLPVLGLAILAFAERPRFRNGPSVEYRWPLALIQILFTFNYTFSAVAKVESAGLGWASAANLRDGILMNATYELTPRLLAKTIADSPLLAGFIIISAFAVDCLFVLVPFSKWMRRILIPMALVGHVGIALSIGIVFLSTPYLLVYVNWDWVAERMRHRTAQQS